MQDIHIDVCGMLHASFYWPKEALVEDLVTYYLTKFINIADVYLVFDHYFETSMKFDTRPKRIRIYQRIHKLAIITPLPPKEIYVINKDEGKPN